MLSSWMSMPVICPRSSDVTLRTSMAFVVMIAGVAVVVALVAGVAVVVALVAGVAVVVVVALVVALVAGVQSSASVLTRFFCRIMAFRVLV
jgi:hypothetical protein